MTLRDPIEYLLNAMELAAQADKPAEHGYGQKRKAVLDAICELRERANRAAPDAEVAQPSKRADYKLAERIVGVLDSAQLFRQPYRHLNGWIADAIIDKVAAVLADRATASEIGRDAPLDVDYEWLVDGEWMGSANDAREALRYIEQYRNDGELTIQCAERYAMTYEALHEVAARDEAMRAEAGERA